MGFYLKVDQPLPFDVRFKITTYYTEWDDRYDPPQEVSHEDSDVAILYSGTLESRHESHKQNSAGVDQNTGTYFSFIINGNEYDGDEIISINGKKYQISGVKI